MMIELDEILLKYLWPVTIVMDRYNGTYSGGRWLAFQMDRSDISYSVGAGDSDEMNFWDDEDNKLEVGIGNTIADAGLDLVKKMLLTVERIGINRCHPTLQEFHHDIRPLFKDLK